LEILHAYHRENHTIKDVYDQVATLFHNHTDLLEEFTQFLPDPNPPAPSQTLVPQRGQKSRGKKRDEKLKERESIKDSHSRDKDKGVKRSKKVEELRRHDDERSTLHATYEEFQFFYRIKSKINNPEVYTEFLRCLNLHCLDIFTKMDLVIMVRDLWGRKFPNLFEQFKQFIHFNELLAEPEPKQLPTPPSHWMEIDFSTCKRYGPSYRALPKNYPQPICSERTELGRSVLNDTWVSVPTGSEDFTFKNSRKNQYEEMLFKCEDDRFELDLVIELNSSAMRALEAIQRNISKMKKEELVRFRLEPLSGMYFVVTLLPFLLSCSAFSLSYPFSFLSLIYLCGISRSCQEH
jgi:paired amphipathic helix protein Sin3a